jgi:hypothetical protein
VSCWIGGAAQVGTGPENRGYAVLTWRCEGQIRELAVDRSRRSGQRMLRLNAVLVLLRAPAQ